MSRSVALRTFSIFLTLAAVAAIVGFSSQVPMAEAAFLIGTSVAGLMLLFALFLPRPEPQPIRVRVRPRR